MFRFVVLSCAVFALVQGNTTQVSQCLYHSGPLPNNTYFEGCSTPPCAWPQSQDAVINFDFVTPGPVQNMSTFAIAIRRNGMIESHIPYNLAENSVTCNFLTNATCPVQGGQLLKYTLRMRYEQFFRVGTQFFIDFRIRDVSNENVLICVRVPMEIVAPVAE